MAPKMYEIKVFKSERECRETPPFLTGLDLDDAVATVNQLNRHLLGAALRSGSRRGVHLFHLEARAADNNGQARGRALFRWVLPADEEA